MGVLHQQVGQAARFASLGALIPMVLVACEGAPARTKPWLRGAAETTDRPSPAIEAQVQEELEARDRLSGRSSLRVGVAALPSVSIASGHLGLLFGAVFEPLVPELASASLTDDGNFIELSVRANVALHNGNALTAADVRYSIETARRGLLKEDLRDIAAVEQPTPMRLRLRLRRPNGYVLRALEEVPVARRGGTVGSGPFVVAEVGETAIRLEPFARHRSQTERRPAELRLARDPARAIAAVQTGELDVTYDRLARRAPVRGARTVELATSKFRYLAFNAKRSLFSDPEVRRAASLVLDRRVVASDGHRRRARARRHPQFLAGPISAPPEPLLPADRRAAAELLDRAGWTAKADGTRERDKQKLIAVAITVDAENPEVALVFDQLRAGGFVLDVRTLDQASYAKALRKGEFDVALLEWTGFRDWDLSPLLESRGALNTSRVESSVLDAALASMRDARSVDERRARAPQLIAALEEVVPLACIAQPIERLIVGQSVVGTEQLDGRLDVRKLVRVPVVRPSRDSIELPGTQR